MATKDYQNRPLPALPARSTPTAASGPPLAPRQRSKTAIPKPAPPAAVRHRSSTAPPQPSSVALKQLTNLHLQQSELTRKLEDLESHLSVERAKPPLYTFEKNELQPPLYVPLYSLKRTKTVHFDDEVLFEEPSDLALNPRSLLPPPAKLGLHTDVQVLHNRDGETCSAPSPSDGGAQSSPLSRSSSNTSIASSTFSVDERRGGTMSSCSSAASLCEEVASQPYQMKESSPFQSESSVLLTSKTKKHTPFPLALRKSKPASPSPKPTLCRTEKGALSLPVNPLASPFHDKGTHYLSALSLSSDPGLDTRAKILLEEKEKTALGLAEVELWIEILEARRRNGEEDGHHERECAFFKCRSRFIERD